MPIQPLDTSVWKRRNDYVPVCVWPDGTWCLKEDLSEYSFMSDDYATIMISDEDPDGIDMAVEQHINQSYKPA